MSISTISCRRAEAAGRRLVARFLAAGLAVLAATAAAAHSGPATTVPADGAVLERAPPVVVLTFAKRVRLTRVRLTHAGGSPVDLDVGGRKGFATRFEIPLTGMGKGLYRIEWRGLAADGHAMRDGFGFRVE